MFVCRSLFSFAGGRMKVCRKDLNLLLVNEMPFVKRFISFFLSSMFGHFKDPDVLLVSSIAVQVGEGDYQEEDAQEKKGEQL